jgi:hypothetical protein
MENDEVKCLLQATVRLEKRLNELERELHPPKPVTIRRGKQKRIAFRVRRSYGSEE